MIAQEQTTFKSFISRHFLRSALLPLLVIELSLIIIYFVVNSYNVRKTVITLESVSHNHLHDLAEGQSAKISEQLHTISAVSSILQKETSRFFSSPYQLKSGVHTAEFSKMANGVYCKTNDNGGAALFYSTLTTIGPREKEKAEKSEILDPLYRHAMESDKTIVAVYFNTFDSMCRYYPFSKELYSQFPKDMNIPQYNFYYLADAAHNPEKKVVWTDAYLDPAGQGWMMSCIAPIYRKDFLEGVVGIDMTIDRVIKEVLALKLPWNSKAFLMDQKGTIMAMPPEIENILGLAELRQTAYSSQVLKDTFKPEEFNLLKSKFPAVAATVSTLLNKPSGIAEILLKNKPYLLAQATVPETQWKLCILTDKSAILAPVNNLRKSTRTIGFTAIGLMLIFYMTFFLYLFRNTSRMAGDLAKPVEAIVNASHGVVRGDYSLKLPDSRIVELSTLSSSFTIMAKELKQLYTDLETKVETRTAELRRMQTKLLQNEKMASIGQLAAGVAHEINNPIGFMLSNLETLKSYCELLIKFSDTLSDSNIYQQQRKTFKIDLIQHDLDNLISETIEGGLRIRNIVQNLKGFAHIDSQGSQPANLNELMDKTLAVVWNEVKYKAEVIKNYEDIPLTRCNGGQINQVFLNLLINASQAIETQGRISIRTWSTSQEVFVSVSDTGTGIPKEIQNRIFEPFFTTKDVGKGTGLGLSISYDIIKGHDGEISVESELGKGTTFTIKLPIRA